MDKPFAPSLTDHEASESISKLGIKKTNSRPWQLLLLGMLAGLYIGFGGHLFLVTLQNGMGKVAGGAMFSVGLILVVVAGAELFTGNVTILIGVLSNVIPVRKMLTNWTFLYLGNFLGSLVFAWLMYQTGLLGRAGELNDLGALAANVADYKLQIPFMEAVLRGIFCNILVILAIIMAVIAKDVTSKILCIVFPITCFVACGFEHSVANMYLIPLGLLAKGESLPHTFVMFQNLIPVTIGNVIGGVFILTIHPNRIRQIAVLLKKGYKKEKV